MKILINTATTYKGGGIQVARSLIEECMNFDEHEYHVIVGGKLSKLLDESEYPQNFSFYPVSYRPATRVFSLRSHNNELKKIEAMVKPEVVFTTSGPAYWRPEAPHLVGYNLPHYIYKDSPFFDQISFQNRLKWFVKGAIIKFFLKKEADAFVVQTDDVNVRLRQWIQNKMVYTVSNTFSRHYINPKKAPDKLPEKKGEEFRFLSLSAWYTHKNLNIIPRVIETLPENIKQKVRFVLTLPGDIFKEHFSQVEKGSILNVGPVKPEEGPALYEECDALFLPTLLECFSASYAEAMRMEKPILTSDLGFARTVCGEAALYFDPLNQREISEKIVTLVETPFLQKELIELGKVKQTGFLSAKDRAKEYLRICKDLADA